MIRGGWTAFSSFLSFSSFPFVPSLFFCLFSLGFFFPFFFPLKKTQPLLDMHLYFCLTGIPECHKSWTGRHWEVIFNHCTPNRVSTRGCSVQADKYQPRQTLPSFSGEPVPVSGHPHPQKGSVSLGDITCIAVCAQWERSGSIFVPSHPLVLNIAKTQTRSLSASIPPIPSSLSYWWCGSRQLHLRPAAAISLSLSSLQIHPQSDFCLAFACPSPTWHQSLHSVANPFLPCSFCKQSAFSTTELARFCPMPGTRILGVCTGSLLLVYHVEQYIWWEQRERKG